MQNIGLRLSFRQLRLLIAIAEAGNLVGAAKRLNMTQPAVTKGLQEAEVSLGFRLFERTNRGVIPTDYGQALVTHAQLIVRQLSHATEELRDLHDGAAGRVAVGTTPAASVDLLPRAIAKLRQERPRVSVKVVEGSNDSLLPSLVAGDLDFVIGRLPELPHGKLLGHEALFGDIACIVAQPRHPALRESLQLRDLDRYSWVLPTQESTQRQQIEAAFANENACVPENAVDSVSYLAHRTLVTEADFLAIWPWQIARPDVKAGRIALLPFVLHPTFTSIGITTRANVRLSPAIEMLLACLRSIAGTLEPCPLLVRETGAPEPPSSGNSTI
jgi:DNA-binding transcriptional LysR family regulator